MSYSEVSSLGSAIYQLNSYFSKDAYPNLIVNATVVDSNGEVLGKVVYSDFEEGYVFQPSSPYQGYEPGVGGSE